MNTLLPTLVSWLQIYGYPALWLSIFIAAIGAPLPITLVLLAAGAFSALGDFNVGITGIVALSASVAGDSMGYLLGHLVGSRLLTWLTARKRLGFISPAVIKRASIYFDRHGGMAVFLSRCLIPALGGAINLLAGSNAYSYRRFLAYDISGEALNTALPLALGYIFSASWDAIGAVLSSASLLLLALIVAGYLTIHVTRMLRHVKEEKADRVQLSADEEVGFPEISKKG